MLANLAKLAKLEVGYVEIYYFPIVKNMIISKNFRTYIKNYDIYRISKDVIIHYT